MLHDPDDPSEDELGKLAPLQRARESLLVELRAAKEQLSGPSSRGASPKREAAAAAPSVTTVAKISATPKYPPYPSDVAHPPFTREVEDACPTLDEGGGYLVCPGIFPPRA